MVDFVWSVRYHHEANVRRAALLAASRTIALTPVDLLISDFLADFNEIQAWLVAVYNDDPDDHCRCRFTPLVRDTTTPFHSPVKLSLTRSLAAAGLLEMRKVAEAVTRQQLDDPTNLLTGSV